MSDQQPIHYIDLIPTPEGMQHIAQVLCAQITNSKIKIADASGIQEALWDNDLALDQPSLDRSQNKLLYEALDLGLSRIIEQEEERICKIEEGLSHDE